MRFMPLPEEQREAWWQSMRILNKYLLLAIEETREQELDALLQKIISDIDVAAIVK